MQELLAIPDRNRTDAEWDELNELEIALASGNRPGAPDPQQRRSMGVMSSGQQPKMGGGRPQGQGKNQGGGGGGLTCPRHGFDDDCFWPVGLASITAIPAASAITSISQNRVGIGALFFEQFVTRARATPRAYSAAASLGVRPGSPIGGLA